MKKLLTFAVVLALTTLASARYIGSLDGLLHENNGAVVIADVQAGALINSHGFLMNPDHSLVTSGGGAGTVTGVSGTTNQVTCSGTTSVTCGLSSTLIAPGTLSAVTSIDATKLSGNLPAISGASLTGVNAATLGSATFAAPGAIGGGTAAAGTFTANTAATYATATNCAAAGSAANPSLVACAAAAAGTFSCDPAASTRTCTIATTAVTANSRIFIQPTAIGSGCNTASDTGLASPRLASLVASTSFTINLGTYSTKECFDYWVVN